MERQVKGGIGSQNLQKEKEEL